MIIIITVLLFFLFIINKYNCNEKFTKINVINKYFDSVNVISLQKRKKYMENFLKKLNIKANIVDATLVKDIDYQKLRNNNFYIKKYCSNNNCKNRGRIACHYSQIKLIKEFLKSNDKTLFIFEDDVDINVNKNYENIIENSMSNIPDDWDIVFFGMCGEDCRKLNKRKVKGTTNLYKLKAPKCRHAYGLSRKGAEKILKYTIPMKNNGDKMYSKNISNGKLKAYGIYEPIFYQNRIEKGSTIGNNFTFIEIILSKFINLFYKKKINEYNLTQLSVCHPFPLLI